jgi:hypothetical protein
LKKSQKLAKMQLNPCSSFVLRLKAVPSLRRRPVLNLKRLVTPYNVFKTFHLTLVLVKKQSLHSLRLT